MPTVGRPLSTRRPERRTQPGLSASAEIRKYTYGDSQPLSGNSQTPGGDLTFDQQRSDSSPPSMVATVGPKTAVVAESGRPAALRPIAPVWPLTAVTSPHPRHQAAPTQTAEAPERLDEWEHPRRDRHLPVIPPTQRDRPGFDPHSATGVNGGKGWFTPVESRQKTGPNPASRFALPSCPLQSIGELPESC